MDVRGTVERVWCELLQVETAAPDDDFFQMGGDSLLALELVTKVEEATGCSLPVDVVFMEGTFGAVVTFLQQGTVHSA